MYVNLVVESFLLLLHFLFFSFQLGVDMFSDIYFPLLSFKPKTRSLPGHYRSLSAPRSRKVPLSMYSSPQTCSKYFYPIESYYSPSQSSLNSSYQQQIDPSFYKHRYASSFYNINNSDFFGRNLALNPNAFHVGTNKIKSWNIHDDRKNLHVQEFYGTKENCNNKNWVTNKNSYFIQNEKEAKNNNNEPIYFDPETKNDVSNECKNLYSNIIDFDVRSYPIIEENYGEI